MTVSHPIVRFAPSPTGKLHIGNIRTALYNWLFAQKNGGQFILRLDDTDVARSTQAFADGIVTDLAWLGIVADQTEKQSDRFDVYDKMADMLRQKGLLYACYETPEEIERRRKRLMARGLPPVYDRAALKMSEEDKQKAEDEGRRPHWRFLLPNFDETPFETKRTEVHWDDVMRGPQTVDLASMSDLVLIRADGTYLYTLPSVVDDIDMGLTHIIRGGDHVTNTGAQIALFEALGAKAPSFGHHNLLMDASGEGLSKRKGALSIESLRDDGFEPMAVASLATLIGTGQAVEACSTTEQLADTFDPTKVSRSDAKFDVNELSSLSQKLLHERSYDDVKGALVDLGCDLGTGFWDTVRPNLTRLGEVKLWRDVVEGTFETREFSKEDVDYLALASTLLADEAWDEETWSRWTGRLKEQTGRKGRALFMPLRQAITGLDHGPDMGAMLTLIGQENTIRRLP